jgi:hypothetical protein
LRLIDAPEKPFALLLLRQVEVEFDDPGSIVVEVALKPNDGAITIAPNRFLIDGRQAFAAKNFGVNAHNHAFF